MGALTRNQRVLTISRQIDPESLALEFEVIGTLFPNKIDFTVNTYNTLMRFTSNAPNTIFVDYADGTPVQSFPMVWQSGLLNYTRRFYLYQPTIGDVPASGMTSHDIPIHYYQDLGSATGTVDHNYPVSRKIRIWFSDERSIIGIESQYIRAFGSFPRNIGAYSSLDTLNLVYLRNISYFPTTLLRTSVTSITLSRLGSALMLGGIPSWVLRSPLTQLNFTDSINLSDLENSGFNKIDILAGTLKNLTVSLTQINLLPDEFMMLQNLNVLVINSNRFKTIPSQINSLTSLEGLNFLGGSSGTTYCENWGDISSLVNLTTLDYHTSFNPIGNPFTALLPAYFSGFTKLKTVRCYSVFFQNQTRCDQHVEQWYNTVTANASMATGNTAFRNMSIMYYSSNAIVEPYNLRPSGTYQQPTGYVQGSNNGSPASAMEMIWVLTNQYGHSWTVKPA